MVPRSVLTKSVSCDSVLFRSRVELFIAPDTPAIIPADTGGSKGVLCLVTTGHQSCGQSYSVRISQCNERKVFFQRPLERLEIRYSTPGPYFYIHGRTDGPTGGHTYDNDNEEVMSVGVRFPGREEADRFAAVVNTKSQTPVREIRPKVLFNPRVQQIPDYPSVISESVNTPHIKKWHIFTAGVIHWNSVHKTGDKLVDVGPIGACLALKAGHDRPGLGFKYRHLWRQSMDIPIEAPLKLDDDCNDIETHI